MSDTTLVVDPALGHPTALRLREELARGEWQNAHSFLDGLRDWDERAFFVGALTEWPGRPPWIEEWYRSKGRTSGVAALVRGAHSLNWAWEARGGGSAATVSRESAATFLERLANAERDLEQAALQDAEDPTPWALRIATGMGRNVGEDVLGRRFEQALRRDLDSRAAYARRLVSLTAKWGGSDQAMFRFARDAAGKAALGSSLHILVAWAHLEKWLGHAASGEAGAAFAYLRNEDVRREVLDARGKLFAAPAISPIFEMNDRNILAFCLWRCGEKATAGQELGAIGARISRVPWAYLGTPERAFVQARAECLGIGEEQAARSMSEMADKAVSHARENHQRELDFSWGSLDAVDELLAGYHATLAKEPDAARRQQAMSGLTMTLGAYVGEVARRLHGGCWITSPDPSGPVPLLVCQGRSESPFKLVAVLLQHGPGRRISDLLKRWLDPQVATTSGAEAGAKASPAEHMQKEAQRLVEFSRQGRGPELTFDEASLPVLDRLLKQWRQEIAAMAPGERKLTSGTVGLRVGAYIGEILCRRRGCAWCDYAVAERAQIPVVDLGGAMALTIPAAVGLLEDGAVKLGDKTARTASEYYQEVCRAQEEVLIKRLAGTGTLEELRAALSSDPKLSDTLIGILSSALQTASCKWGLNLDFSPASLEGLDALLEELHKGVSDSNAPPDRRPTEAQMNGVVTIWGVYLGEVVRRNLGGRWLNTPMGEAGPHLRLECGGRELLPLSRVFRRIRDGVSKSVRAFYAFAGGLDAAAPPASAAAAAASPTETLKRFVAEVIEIALKLDVPGNIAISPFLLSKMGGSNTLEALALIPSDKTMEYGRKRAAAQPSEVTLVAFVYEVAMGEVGKPKGDAIVLEVHERGQPVGFVFGQAFRRVPGGAVEKCGNVFEMGRCAAFLGND
jgi:hypothetical protein